MSSHVNCRVLIILGLDVLGQADTVGNPQEYDKIAAGMIAQAPAGGPAHYMNGRGLDPSKPYVYLWHFVQCCSNQKEPYTTSKAFACTLAAYSGLGSGS